MKDDRVFLNHIREFCEDLQVYLYEIESLEELKKSKLYQDAIVRKLEIIGEASNNISKELKDKYPDVPWREIKALRNIMAHEYFGLNFNTIWNVLTTKIPLLHKQIKEILKELS